MESPVPSPEPLFEEMHEVARDVEALGTRTHRLGANVDHRLYGLGQAPGLDP